MESRRLQELLGIARDKKFVTKFKKYISNKRLKLFRNESLSSIFLYSKTRNNF